MPFVGNFKLYKEFRTSLPPGPSILEWRRPNGFLCSRFPCSDFVKKSKAWRESREKSLQSFKPAL